MKELKNKCENTEKNMERDTSLCDNVWESENICFETSCFGWYCKLCNISLKDYKGSLLKHVKSRHEDHCDNINEPFQWKKLSERLKREEKRCKARVLCGAEKIETYLEKGKPLTAYKCSRCSHIAKKCPKVKRHIKSKHKNEGKETQSEKIKAFRSVCGRWIDEEEVEKIKQEAGVQQQEQQEQQEQEQQEQEQQQEEQQQQEEVALEIKDLKLIDMDKLIITNKEDLVKERNDSYVAIMSFMPDVGCNLEASSNIVDTYASLVSRKYINGQMKEEEIAQDVLPIIVQLGKINRHEIDEVLIEKSCEKWYGMFVSNNIAKKIPIEFRSAMMSIGEQNSTTGAPLVFSEYKSESGHHKVNNNCWKNTV